MLIRSHAHNSIPLAKRDSRSYKKGLDSLIHDKSEHVSFKVEMVLESM